MHKTLLFLFCSFIFVSILTILVSADFSDVSENDDYYEAIRFVEEEGIVSGYPDGSYKPDNRINRAEFTKIIMNAQFEESDIQDCTLDPTTFPDFDHNEWFTPYVCMAKEEGIISGYPDGTFQPANEISFAEAAKIVVNGFGYEVEENTELWYEPYVDILEEKEAIPSSIEEVSDLLTRGEMAEIIYRLLTAEEGSSPPPSLELIQEPMTVSGASGWLFTVDDGEAKLAVSAETNGNIMMGRLDPENPEETIDWKTVMDARDYSVADHWHIFAHDYHWIVFATNGAKNSYLIKLDKDFEQMGFYPVADEDDDLGGTNDMFMVEEPDGLAIGHFDPQYGHRLYRMNTEGEVKETVTIGGGEAKHGNGASALATESGYLVFAPLTLNPSVESHILQLTFDEDWNLVSTKTLIEEENTHLAMATVALLDTGYKIVNVRFRDLSSIEEETTTSGSSGLPSDAGALVQYIIDPDGEILSQETILEYEDQGNRPHTTLFNDLLITSWDTPKGLGLQIQKVD